MRIHREAWDRLLTCGGRWGRRLALVGAGSYLLVILFTPTLTAEDFNLAVDVPHNLTGLTTLPPNWFLQAASGTYSSLFPILPDGAEASGLYRGADGSWLVTPAFPTILGGSDVGPRDVVLTFSQFGPFSLWFDGNAAGIPNYARIDAIYLDPSEDLILSFDVPVNLGGIEYSRSDLVHYQGGTFFTLEWDAESAGVPSYANVVGADRNFDGRIVVTFDVPTRIAGTEYLPGQLVAWNGMSFSSFSLDPNWPAYLQLRDFSLIAPVGAVPDGASVPGTSLAVSHAGVGDITLSWGYGCLNSLDYDVYEGTIGSYYSHNFLSCGTDGQTQITFTPSPGSQYYLVVPRSADREGSYGKDSSGVERPAGIVFCMSQKIGACP